MCHYTDEEQQPIRTGAKKPTCVFLFFYGMPGLGLKKGISAVLLFIFKLEVVDCFRDKKRCFYLQLYHFEAAFFML